MMSGMAPLYALSTINLSLILKKKFLTFWKFPVWSTDGPEPKQNSPEGYANDFLQYISGYEGGKYIDGTQEEHIVKRQESREF